MNATLYEPVPPGGTYVLPARRSHPLLRLLASFPIACFSCALLTDIAYTRTANMLWSDFSDWLLAAGMAGGVLAAIVGIGSLFGDRRGHSTGAAIITVLGTLLVLAAGFLNNLVHSRDAWTSVMPEGIALSAITVVFILLTIWLAALANRRRADAIVPPGVRV
jgi:uncharacterized membrane protein